MTNGQSKPNESLETKMNRIMLLSSKDPEKEFKWLMPHYNKENLISCFNALDGKKAVGIDNKTKKEYGENLETNIDNLISRMKTMSYRPLPVKEILIPKEGKKNEKRPLGIGCIEDKIVQSMTAKILNAIYDPIFLAKSFGFRPRISCHDAIKSVDKHLMQNNCEIVIDIDLKNFFGKIDHKMLTELLRIKIKDEKFVRYVVRMLKAGILSEGNFIVSEEGSPQGNIASPVLANVFAHYVFDTWFQDVVKKHTKGTCEFFRYADDVVICCQYQTDAVRVKKALEQRLGKYRLELNQDKTKFVRFSKREYDQGIKQETFDFLGFTFYIAKSRNGYTIVKLKTARKRFKSKLEKVKLWCRSNRHKGKLKAIWIRFCSKLRGHYQYYGVSFNTKSMEIFRQQAVKIYFKWMNRRSQRRSFDWDKFNLFIKEFPLPVIKIHHRLF
ncbi:MAG: group II intron reverse transcriptase/maturase [Candidatus Brocadiales bacterium]|nr:group II intron reverse transcriptase/maturase [Candidatus Brocadiales bacterium]